MKKRKKIWSGRDFSKKSRQKADHQPEKEFCLPGGLHCDSQIRRSCFLGWKLFFAIYQYNSCFVFWKVRKAFLVYPVTRRPNWHCLPPRCRCSETGAVIHWFEWGHRQSADHQTWTTSVKDILSALILPTYIPKPYNGKSFFAESAARQGQVAWVYDVWSWAQ